MLGIVEKIVTTVLLFAVISGVAWLLRAMSIPVPLIVVVGWVAFGLIAWKIWRGGGVVFNFDRIGDGDIQRKKPKPIGRK